MSCGVYAASGLFEACETSHGYWHCVDRQVLGQLVRKLHVYLEAVLSRPAWQTLGLPHTGEPAIPGHAPTAVFEVFVRGTQELTDMGERPLALDQLSDAFLQESWEELRDLMVLQCIYPDPEASPEFRMPARALFMLRKYWEGLYRILAATGEGEVGWTPHPLTRLVVNLQERFRACLSSIEDSELHGAFETVAGVTESMLAASDHDFSVSWECGDAAIAAACFVTLEKAWFHLGSAQFDLTFAEKGFLDTVDAHTLWYKEQVEKEWKRIWTGASRSVPPKAPQAASPRPLAEYISRVELALRRVVTTAYQARFGDSWPDQIRQALDSGELEETEERLAKEGQSDQDIIHMLNPQPLRQLVTRDWNVTGAYFPGAARKQVNSLIDKWLTARTKVAHNRPPHLWPEIEQQRARVACHDLLDTIDPRLRGPT